MGGWTKWILSVGSLVVVAFQVCTSRLLLVGDGCGWDGAVYCAMFRGEPAPEPFARRILAPTVARLFAADPVSAFQALDALTVVLLLIVGATLVADRGTGAVVAVCVVVLTTRNLVHFVLIYPVITDPLALLLLLGGLASLRFDKAWPLLALTGALLPLARENYGMGLIGACFALAIIERRKLPLLGVVVTLTSTATSLLTHHAPGSLGAMLQWFRSSTSSPGNFLRLVVAVVIAVGWSWIVLLAPSIRGRLGSFERALLIGAGLFGVASIFGGQDTERILMPVGILLSVVAIRVVQPKLLAWVAVSYAVVQSPFVVVTPTTEGWLNFFSLRYNGYVEWGRVISVGVAPALLGLLVMMIGLLSARDGFRVRRKASRTTSA